jgi:uncharacterized protein involved in high-affinity Fe2+ transport
MRINVPDGLMICLCFLFIFLLNKGYSQMEDMQGMVATSAPKLPLMVSSNEATKEQLAYARAEGDSVDKCTAWIISQAGSNGGQMRAGEYKITYAITAPEGWYEYINQHAQWQSPTNANAHLWLFVQDGADGRIVPPLDIRATIRNASGNLVEQKIMRFAWMPLVNGYGENIQLPGEGTYSLELSVTPPIYHRHDPYNGDRFTEVTTAVIPLQISSLANMQTLSDKMEAAQSLAKKAGEAYSNTLQTMYKQANDGKDTTTGDYFLACAVEYSEGYWYLKQQKLVYEMTNELSAAHNAHVEVVARDVRTGRFLHDLHVTATLYDNTGKKINTKMEMFMWHPWLYHYGENWRVPHAGKYRVHVHIDPPAYRRYGQTLGKQFVMPADMDFTDITIKTGQK